MSARLRLELAQVHSVDDPLGLGRVQVKYADRVTTSKQVSAQEIEAAAALLSDWLLVASPFAGNAFGMFSLPEQGTPALVAFATEDRTCGYVVGFVWTGASKPPVEGLETQKKVWVIQTSTKKTIRLDDSDAASIEITDEKGNSVKIDTQANEISLISKGDLSIKAEGNITISGKGKIAISSQEIEFSQGSS
jgi:uncharacterized protein involved in type VI secretion and phage assembly